MEDKFGTVFEFQLMCPFGLLFKFFSNTYITLQIIKRNFLFLFQIPTRGHGFNVTVEYLDNPDRKFSPPIELL
jgi:hypothetical protein